MNTASHSARSVLLVEDEVAIADALIYALSTAGVVAEHAPSLSSARGRLRDSPPLLLVLDLGLPDGSGLDLCREIRRGDFDAPDLPIVMLTAMGDELDRIVGLELGADDYISKPFSPREVVLRIKTILRRAHIGNAGSIASEAVSQGLQFDEAGQRFRYANQWLDLTRRELHLLQLLMQAPGRIYSRETLLDRVWGRDAESMERTVDTHIKTLRAKLRSANPALDLIVTHRGLRFRLSPLRWVVNRIA